MTDAPVPRCSSGTEEQVARAMRDADPLGRGYRGDWQAYVSQARAAINVIGGDAQDAPVPDGYALVPLTPTPRMVEIGCDNNPTQWNEGTPDGFAADVANDVYVSMVRASSVPSTPRATGAD